MIVIYSKEVLENYARWMLIIEFSFSENDLIRADMPDLQDDTHNIGIEVVEDTYEDEKELERFWVKYQNLSMDEIPQKMIDGYEKRGGILSVSDDKLVGGRLLTKPNTPEHLITTIKEKIAKLNSGKYKKFRHSMLYVFCDTVTLFESNIQSVIDTIYQDVSPLQYERIYIDGYYEIVCCDMKAKTFERKTVSAQIRNDIMTRVSYIKPNYFD